MPGIARLYSEDIALGILLRPGAPSVYADFKIVSLIGDLVAPHGPGIHSGPILVSNGSPSVRADYGIVAKESTVASCGHKVTPGSKTVFVE
jgi:uncharacterized Zn-binding protein involved in type VI secretion